MASVMQMLRSVVARSRPTGRKAGELYINMADRQVGVVDDAANPRDLMAIPFYSDDSNYITGSLVAHDHAIWRAKQDVAGGTFNPAAWEQAAADLPALDAKFLPASGGHMTKALRATTVQARTWDGARVKPWRNLIMNGDERINQREVASWAAVADGAYGYDRWKKIDAGNKTQTIEDGMFTPGAVHTLSYERAGVRTAQQVTAPASGNWTLPNIPIDAALVQLEEGNKATPFEQRVPFIEEMLCRRYLWRPSLNGYVATTWALATNQGAAPASIPVAMRAAAPVRRFDGGWLQINNGSGALAVSGKAFATVRWVIAAQGASFIAGKETTRMVLEAEI